MIQKPLKNKKKYLQTFLQVLKIKLAFFFIMWYTVFNAERRIGSAGVV